MSWSDGEEKTWTLPIPEDDDYILTPKDIAKSLGLDTRFDENAVLDWLRIYERFRLFGSPSPFKQWVSSDTLMKRWNVNEDELSKRVLDRLPMYVPNQNSEMEPIYEEWLEPYYKPISFDSTKWKSGVNIWLTSPRFWWFRKTEVAFFEKVRSLSLNPQELTLVWLTSDEVRVRWKIGPFEKNSFRLADIVTHKKLPAYCLQASGGIEEQDSQSVREEVALFGTPEIYIDDCMFKMRDVWQFETTNCEFLHMSDEDVFTLRIADYVRAWLRWRPDLKNECLKERLYSRSSPKTQEGMGKYFRGTESAKLMKALGRKGALSDRTNRQGGRTKNSFSCPWKSCTIFAQCPRIKTSR